MKRKGKFEQCSNKRFKMERLSGALDQIHVSPKKRKRLATQEEAEQKRARVSTPDVKECTSMFEMVIADLQAVIRKQAGEITYQKHVIDSQTKMIKEGVVIIRNLQEMPLSTDHHSLDIPHFVQSH